MVPAGPNVPYACQHLIEVVWAAIRVLQPFIIHHEALDQVLLQDRAGPAAELHATGRTHAVAHGQDSVQVVEREGALHLTGALGLNYQGFLDSCRRVQFPIPE